MKKNKKSSKSLFLIICGSLLTLIVIAFTIKSLQESQNVESQAQGFNLDGIKNTPIPIEGGVGIGAFDAPTELFAPIDCPNTTANANVDVNSSLLGSADWSCDPQAGFTFNAAKFKEIRKSVTFTLTPPTGYSCGKNYSYISTSKEIRYKKQARTEGSGCTANIQPGLATKSIFIWFTLNPLSL